MSNNNQAFIVEGGHKLSGEITPQGAKNEALQVICATILTSEKVTLTNLPNIKDVRMLIQLLEGLGVGVEKVDEHSYTFEANNIDLNYLKMTRNKNTLSLQIPNMVSLVTHDDKLKNGDN